MLPDAPGRLSMTTGWPRRDASFSQKARAALSAPPPAGKGTIILMGRSGQDWAWTAPAPSASKASASTVRREGERNMVVSWMVVLVLDDALLAQPPDVVLAEAGLAQDLVGVLAALRRGSPHRSRRTLQVHGLGDEGARLARAGRRLRG